MYPDENLKNSNNEQSNPIAYRLIYPEIYYKVMPYIVMVCDEMDGYGNMMMSQDMMERLSNDIHDDMLRMYPDLEQYANEQVVQIDDVSSSLVGQDWRRRFRRRGLFRDLIDILLFNEFFRRRRRYY